MPGLYFIQEKKKKFKKTFEEVTIVFVVICVHMVDYILHFNNILIIFQKKTHNRHSMTMAMVKSILFIKDKKKKRNSFEYSFANTCKFMVESS